MEIAEALTAAELAAIRNAVEAVVERDRERVSAYLTDRESVDALWSWADDYGDEGMLDLVLPLGPTREWPIGGVPLTDGTGFALDIPMWAATGRTDLTLRLWLKRGDDGPEIVLEDMHVL